MDTMANFTHPNGAVTIPMNFSGDFRFRKSIQELMLDRLLHVDTLIGLILSILTMFANSVSLFAINYKQKSSSTYMRLVTSLSAADFINGLSVFSHLLHMIFVPLIRPTSSVFACTMTVVFSLYAMSIFASLLTLSTMALDHYLAILQPIQHHTRFRKRNCNLLIVFIWLLAVVCGFSNFLNGLSWLKYKPSRLSFCEFIQMSAYNVEYVVWSVAILCMIIISYTYSAICCKVCAYTRFHSIRRGYLRNHKAMMTTLIIVGLFLVCWLPTCIFQIVLIYKVEVDPQYVRKYVRTFKRVNKYLNYLLLLNSLFDPIVYAMRLREIKACYRRLFNCCNERVFSKCYRNWSSTVGETDVNSYVYHRNRPQSHNHTQSQNRNSHALPSTPTVLTNGFHAPLCVKFSKSKSSFYDHSHPEEFQASEGTSGNDRVDEKSSNASSYCFECVNNTDFTTAVSTDYLTVQTSGFSHCNHHDDYNDCSVSITTATSLVPTHCGQVNSSENDRNEMCEVYNPVPDCDSVSVREYQYETSL